MKPLFSIITPSWNRVVLLPEMIEGILEQTDDDWELIVVSDGCSDTTPELMEHYCKDKKIRYYQKKHTGIADTRNYGNARAKGEWLVIADSDELWLNNRLELTRKYIKKHPDVEFIAGGMILTSVKGGFNREYWQPKMPTYKRLKRKEQGVMHGSCAYKKSVWDKIPYRKEQKINDDFWFIVDLHNAGVKFGILDKPLMRYRILNDGISIKYGKEIQKEMNRKLKTEYIRRNK